MALDMILARFKKIDIDTTEIYTEEELDELELNYLTENEVNDILPKELFNDFAKPITLEMTRWDFAAVYKEFQKSYPDLYKEDVSLVELPELDEEGIYSSDPDATFKPKIIGTRHLSEGSYYLVVDYGRFIDDEKGNRYDNYPNIDVAILSRADEENFTFKVFETHYVYKTENVVVQIDGLNDYGLSLLPKNCTYSNDRDLIKELVEKGGLRKQFLTEWVDGETGFYPWL